jgi:hypothetical protein
MNAHSAPVPPPAPPPSAPPPRAAARPFRQKPGHWVLLVVGVVLAALGLGLTVGGAIALGADAAQRDGGGLTGRPTRVLTPGYAVTTPTIAIDGSDADMPATPPFADLATVTVRVQPVVPDREVFVGIAPAADVAAYLDGVPHTDLGDRPWTDYGEDSDWSSWPPRDEQELPRSEGDRAPAAPAAQDFWTASATGTGTQEITVDVAPGDWTLVVMNADASRPVWAVVQPEVRTAVLGPVGGALLAAGLVGLALGVLLLLLGSAGLGRDIDPGRPGRGPGAALPGGDTPPGPLAVGPTPDAVALTVYPAGLVGFLDRHLSRWLWLVKWLLAIPHYILLALLWFALLVTTIAAGLAILFTGRYPRSWFHFSVGVLRWNWRVGFYASSALGTDRYPPFTLAPADYPAALEVGYPERLSHGLVLVKWWLLAIPHLVVLGIITGNAGMWGGMRWREDVWWVPPLLGFLVFVAAVVLLFTGRYPHGIFFLVLGLNRWVYRVLAYVLLLRDEYPPFRLDQGPTEPPAPALEPQGTPGPAPAPVAPPPAPPTPPPAGPPPAPPTA